MHFIRLVTVLAIGASVAGCSTSPEAIEQNDPFEPINRQVFEFNHALDHQVAIPAASFYRSAAPPVFREHLHYFLTNLHLPVTFVNDVLQGNFERGSIAIGRFTVNTTLGVGGVLDVATDWGLPYHAEDFGQTLGWYGVPEGPYLMLPLAGPALPRDIAGSFVDGYMNPLGYIRFHNKKYYWSWPLRLFSLVDARSHNIDSLREMERSSIDLYATTRSIYRASREAEVRNGVPDVADLPDF
ncbi:MAG TPA: VacJ family lipoprotein [Rhizomicrobium sp.]|nr:VacJ family lipoprotein [Rhizomicrobium sp.]